MQVGFKKVLVLKARGETVTIFWYSPEEQFGGKFPSHAAFTWFLLQSLLGEMWAGAGWGETRAVSLDSMYAAHEHPVHRIRLELF